MDGFRKTGILGGMGVEATLELMKRVHVGTLAHDDQGYAPMFVDMNPQVPSRIHHIVEKTGPDPGPVLARMALRLEQAGAEILAMPCNTAHLYAPQIEAAVGIPLLNMPEMACADVAKGMDQGAVAGILASPATNSTGLFGAFLAKHGVAAVYPENEAGILATIGRIKSSGPTAADITLLETEAATLVSRGAEKIIVGCSEFSLVSNRIRTTVPVFDTLDVLVTAIIRFSGVSARQTATP